MRTTFSADHLCPQCQDVMVYVWVGTRGETRVMEVEHCRPHMCEHAVSTPITPSRTRCPDCGLQLYEMDGILYDEDAALVRHQCPMLAPATAPPPPARPAPRVRVAIWEAYDL